MYHYLLGRRSQLSYSDEWYNSHVNMIQHKNALYQWFSDNHNEVCADGKEFKCASIFVGQGDNSDVRYTLGRHYLEGCFRFTLAGTVEAQFKIQDCFDFDPTIGADLPGIGCVPHRWWTKLAEKSPVCGPFEQIVIWKEERQISTEYTPRVLPVPSCDACTDKFGFCPCITPKSFAEVIKFRKECL